MRYHQLGSAGPQVSEVGFGCMAMSGMYGYSDEVESIATIHAALEHGITLLDTGDFYGMGHNELLIRRAIADRRSKLLLSVKFGSMRGPGGAFLGFDSRPVAVKNFLSYSLQRLGTDYVDIYRPSRVDPNVPIEETMGAIAELVKEGYVRYASLSEASAETAKRAATVVPICDVQLEYSVITRGIEDKIVPSLKSLGISVTAYGILSRGLLSGSRPVGKDDMRAHLPRFTGGNLEQNQGLLQPMSTLAQEKGITPSQLAIAWVLARGEQIVPLLGSRTRPQLAEALGALSVRLSPEDLTRIDQAVQHGKIAGTRYAEAQMRMLDSERC